MRIVLHSFVHICFIFIISINALLFVKNAINSSYSTYSKKILQIYFFFALLFLIYFHFSVLKALYTGKVLDVESGSLLGRLKTWQYIGENMLHSVVCYSFGTILESLERFKMKSIKDQRSMKSTAYFYSFIRYIPVFMILLHLNENLPFYSFLIEIFLIGEYTALILVFSNFYKTIKNVENEVEICLMRDKSMVQFFLANIKSILKRFIVSLGLESLSKVMFLTVMMGKSKKSLTFLYDASNLLKLISIYLLLETLLDLVFIDYGGLKVILNEGENDKFFIFENDENKIENKEVEIKTDNNKEENEEIKEKLKVK